MTAATDLLRSAASAMRERAEAATPGPWESFEMEEQEATWPGESAIWMPDAGHDGALVEKEADAEHIASWHPAVALTVADLLDRWADEIESTGATAAIDDAVVKVAAAYMSGRTA